MREKIHHDVKLFSHIRKNLAVFQQLAKANTLISEKILQKNEKKQTNQVLRETRIMVYSK